MKNECFRKRRGKNGFLTSNDDNIKEILEKLSKLKNFFLKIKEFGKE